jgi:ABC-type Fe3+-hydroxamate transport system substrate-binding protein
VSAPQRDDLGTVVRTPQEVRRIVSLVPSLTEAVAASGGADALVGVTSYCTHPPDVVARIPRVGGTKNPDVPRIVALRPDVVVANEEENRPADLDALRGAGLAVWVTAPRSVPAALDSLARMLSACALGRPDWLDAAEAAWSSPFAGRRRRAFVPIWRRPWMALGRDTFAADVLARLGVDNVLADADDRYPKVVLDDVRALGLELVVLPDEPYAFAPERDLDAFTGWPVDVAFVSGRHLTWYGPSLVEARGVLRRQLANHSRGAVGECRRR